MSLRCRKSLQDWMTSVTVFGCVIVKICLLKRRSGPAKSPVSGWLNGNAKNAAGARADPYAVGGRLVDQLGERRKVF